MIKVNEPKMPFKIINLGRGIPINAGEGFVRLVDRMGDDGSIARAARVSTGSRARDEAADAKLIDSLVRMGHTSPLEHVVCTFHVRTLRAVMDEHTRHRTWSFNAESQRYRDLSGRLVGYVPPDDRIGKQPPKGRNQQGRTYPDLPDPDYNQMVRTAIENGYARAFGAYDEMIKMGAPREIARLVLPMGLFTEYYATVDLWNLCHFFRLRCAPGALWEIQEVASAMKALVAPLVPVALAAFERHILNPSDEVRGLLGAARHSLTTYQGLMAYDRLDDDGIPVENIVIDDADLLARIDKALEGSKG